MLFLDFLCHFGIIPEVWSQCLALKVSELVFFCG